MSELFGLHPWDVDRLTELEFRTYLAALDARVKEAAKQRRQAKRGG